MRIVKLPKKIIFVLLLISYLFFNIELIVFAQGILEDDILDIETSIVLLTISDGENEVFRDPFFEILNFVEEDYYLLPVTLLNDFLDMEINLVRESGELKLGNRKNNKVVIVDFVNKKYSNNVNWNYKVPTIFEGDFYLAPEVFSYLFDLEISWDSSYQEIFIKGDYFLSDEEKNFNEEINSIEEDEELIKNEEEKIIRGKEFSLGSIHYFIKTNYSLREEYNDIFLLSEKLNVYGLYQDWAVDFSLNFAQNIFFEDNKIEVNSFKISREYEDEVIVIGDQDIDFPKTIGSEDLRGLYYQKGPGKYGILAYTSLTGQTQNDSEVILYINDKEYAKKIVEENEYNFNYIPLNMFRLNSIKIIIKNKNGEIIEVINKDITASPRLYEKGTLILNAAGGLYKNENISSWKGKMIGVDSIYSPSNNITLELETTVFNDNNIKDVIYTGGDYGIAIRLKNNLIFSLDWLVSGEKEKFYNGVESSLLYSMKNGHIMGLIYYIPENTTQSIQKGEGEGLRLIGNYDLSKNWTLSPSFDYFNSLKEGNIYLRKEGAFSFIYTKNWRRKDELSFSAAKITSFYNYPEKDMEYLAKNDRYGGNYSTLRIGEGYKIQEKIALYKNNIKLDPVINWGYYNFNCESYLYKKIFSSLLFTNKIKNKGEIIGGKFYNQNLETDTTLKFYAIENILISLNNKINNNQNEDSLDIENNVMLESYFEKNYISLKVSSKNTNLDTNYLRYDLNTSFYPDSMDEQYGVDFSYFTPLSNNLFNKLEYLISYQKLFSNGIQLDLSLSKNYYSFYSREYEYLMNFSLSQAFAFVEDLIIPQKFNNSHHRSFITGIVYLDENNNGKFDENEIRVPGIKMRIDNITAITDKNGRYKINLNFPGIYNINFDYASLIADYTPLTEAKTVELRKNENLALDFALTINGSINGRIFLDENVNGIFDEGETPVKWVGVRLNDDRTGYTDKRGEFYFDNIPLGTHSITLLENSLPKDLKPLKEYKVIFHIKQEDLDKNEIDFPLKYNF